MKKIIIIVIAFVYSFSSLKCDETLDTKGKDFWLTFLPNFNTSSLYIYIVSQKPTSGKIYCTNSLNNTNTVSFSIPNPEEVYSEIFPANYELNGINVYDEKQTRNESEEISHTSFHIVSDDDISVYALSIGDKTSEAFNVIPTDALGKNYFVLTYNSEKSYYNWRGELSRAATPSQFTVLATEDNTKINIIPSTRTQYNGLKTQTIFLNKGESYLVQSDIYNHDNLDLSGSEVVSDRPIAVFSGQQRATIPYNMTGSTSRDCLIEQMIPIETWGYNAILIPFEQHSSMTNPNFDIFRIIVCEDNSTITFGNGQKVKLNKGEFYQGNLTSAQQVKCDKRMFVMTYKKTSNSNSSAMGPSAQGDPLMMTIPPVEQFGNFYRFSNIQYGFNTFANQYLNIVAPNFGLNTIQLDGIKLDSSKFIPIPNTDYSYLIKNDMDDGTHEISGLVPFGIYVYGYGQAISYGYVGGMNLQKYDLESPRLLSKNECFKISGYAADTNFIDSKIIKFVSPENQKINVNVSIDSFKLYSDRVNFKANLLNIYQDGSFGLFVEDSFGLNRSKIYEIPGFTVGINRSVKELVNPEPYLLDEEINEFRLYCKTLEFINYGNFEQNISKMYFKNNSDIKFSSPIPLKLKKGEKIDIDFCHQFNGNEKILDTLIIENSCGSRQAFIFKVNSAVDTDPPNAKMSGDQCNHEFTLFLSDSLYSDMGLDSLEIINKENCNINPIVKNDLFAYYKIEVDNPYLDSYYNLKVSDKSGKSIFIGDTIPGYTISISSAGAGKDSVNSDFGVTEIGAMTCKNFDLYNYGKFTFTIQDASLADNTLFSIPLSQFPIVIEPQSSKPIQICFRPYEYKDTPIKDTLNLIYNCLSKLIPVNSKIDSLRFVDEVKCDLPVQISTKKLPYAAYIGESKPNPAIESILLEFGLDKDQDLDLAIYDFYGNKVKDIYHGFSKAGNFEISINLIDFTDGTYFIYLRTDNELFTKKIIILK